MLILGTGGTSKDGRGRRAPVSARRRCTVSPAVAATARFTYEDAARLHADADVLINTTPGGMYPAVEGCPIALDAFPNLSGRRGRRL